MNACLLNIKNFTTFYNLISIQLPNIQHLILWLDTDAEEAQNIIKNTVSRFWIRALKSINVAKRFDLELLGRVPDPRGWMRLDGWSHTMKGKMLEEFQDGLERLLRPTSLEYPPTGGLKENCGTKDLVVDNYMAERLVSLPSHDPETE